MLNKLQNDALSEFAMYCTLTSHTSFNASPNKTRENDFTERQDLQNGPVSANCHLTRKRPLLGRDSLGREQREIPVLVREWSNRNREWGLLGRDSLERKSREKFLVLVLFLGIWINGRKLTYDNFLTIIHPMLHSEILSPPNPVLVHPESFMEASWSAGTLITIFLKNNWADRKMLAVTMFSKYNADIS